jgi:hypothetical protein
VSDIAEAREPQNESPGAPTPAPRTVDEDAGPQAPPRPEAHDESPARRGRTDRAGRVERRVELSAPDEGRRILVVTVDLVEGE